MASNPEKIGNGAVADSPTTPVGQTPTEAAVRTKATRHPRWTRQETLVLIQAKKMVENGEQASSRYKLASGFVNQTDPKWDMVSSFCQQQGVKRGPVQCRKRWGNLLTDFRKIKKWESNIKEEEGESFWMMRNDRRKEKKLPGFFDEVVYRVLDGGVCTAAAFPLTLIKMAPKPENDDQVEGLALEHYKEDEDDEGEEDEAIVDSEKIGWSTEEENTETNTAGNMFISPLKTPCPNATLMNGSPKMTPTSTLPTSGCQREPLSQEGYKRRRLSPDNCVDTTNFSNNVIEVLRRNSNILKAHLGAQNMNYQLAREQQKEQTDSLVAALGKLTDALTKIADKL